MAPTSGATTRTIRIFRYDPSCGEGGHFDTFVLDIPDENKTTILDVLVRVQKEQGASLAFRYACRVNMCGSCAMVINGIERLACKTSVSQLAPGKDITLRPLSHFPVIKDLVVDMESFFTRFEKALAFYEPRDDSPEPARISADSRERKEIGMAVECIACGCCVSGCTMCHHDDYAGPAALSRSYSLLADSRDGVFDERLARAMASCYDCRTEFNCTEVCPKDISATRAIKSIQLLAVKHGRNHQFGQGFVPLPTAPVSVKSPDRRSFLRQAAIGAVGIGATLALGSAVAGVGLGPSLAKPSKHWAQIGSLENLPVGEVTTLAVTYENPNGLYEEKVTTAVLVSRTQDEIVCFKADCPHLGCRVRWDEASGSFRCACHGGTFDRNGQVLAGPPPRPLDRYAHKIESGQLLLEVG